MPPSTKPKDPVVLSYLALRRAVGFVAVGLSFAVAIPWYALHQAFQTSISSYYYTGMRNLFVGSLCAIATFMFCTRGYDRSDEISGIFSSICAFVVAFFPTPPNCPTSRQTHIGWVHYTAAALLFSTLAFFCLVLFKRSAAPNPTRKKKQRNLVYTICGIAILASIVLLFFIDKVLHTERLIGPIGTAFTFETISLWAFGIAWLVKGEAFLKDEVAQPRETVTADTLLLATPPTRQV